MLKKNRKHFLRNIFFLLSKKFLTQKSFLLTIVKKISIKNSLL